MHFRGPLNNEKSTAIIYLYILNLIKFVNQDMK